MSEDIMQTLDRILEDDTLYNCKKIEVRLNKELYCYLRSKLGARVEDEVRTGIMMGKRYIDDTSVNVIYITFSYKDINKKKTPNTCQITIKHDSVNVGERIEKTAFVTISYTE